MSMPLRREDQTRLGRYEVTGRLGAGGMGAVFLGTDPDGRQVAIKVVRPEFADDPEFRARFRSEVNRARQVPPFSTAEVLDADPDHDPPYLVVEYVDGPSLDTVVRERGPLTGSSLHGLAVGTATALTAIHGTGVIHRDLKPGNVLLAPGGIKVIDFGIARAFEATSMHTRTDQMVGTVAYMAPERFEPAPGAPVGPAADVFAWGAVVAYAAVGRTPFQADSPPATAMRILTQPPDLTGLPPSLREPVERALAKDPRARPTARELLDMLLTGDQPAAAAAGVLPPVPPAPAPPPPDPPVRRSGGIARRVLVITAVAAVVLGGAGLALRAAGDGGGGDGASATEPSGRPDAQPAPSVDVHAAILRGSRQILIHVAEIDRDLGLDVHAAEVAAGDGTGAKSLFRLEPYGVDYLIHSLNGGPQETCLGVKVIPDETALLVGAACAPTKATLFALSATGRRDDKGRPTYFLSNEAYGFVQWDAGNRSLFVQEIGDAPPLSSFSFVDRGKVPTPGVSS